MTLFLFLIPLLLLFHQTSFSNQSASSGGKEEVKQADIDFSNMSRAKGMAAAFIEYVAEDGVLLRPYSYPIIGKEKISELMNQDDGTVFTLIWMPLDADIAESGEIGYTYGTWEMKIQNADKTEEIRKGTYATVWKKNKEGKWKFVLDTGNPGLEPKK
jgi:ketosteroid isomerase-like protein